MSSSGKPARRSTAAEANGRPGASKHAGEAVPEAGAPEAGALEAGLYITATPIGNARDITLRALDILRRADVIAAEDTRVTGRLLSMHGIKGKLVSYREDNAEHATPGLLAQLAAGGSVALVTDAGTPHVSDPGVGLVAAAAAAGHRVVAAPGASALTAALSISGLAAKRMLFAGFLPAAQAARRSELAELKGIDAALVFFEAPHRIVESLADLAAILGPRMAALCREITKLHEEVRRGTLAELAAAAQSDPNLSRGEIVLVIAPPGEAPPASEANLDAALREALRHHRVKDAADAVAGALGLPRRAVYTRALELKDDSDA